MRAGKVAQVDAQMQRNGPVGQHRQNDPDAEETGREDQRQDRTLVRVERSSGYDDAAFHLLHVQSIKQLTIEQQSIV